MRCRQHQEGERLPRKALLVLNVLIASDHCREAGFLGGADQIAVADRRPSHGRGVNGLMRTEQRNEVNRDVVIKQDADVWHDVLRNR